MIQYLITAVIDVIVASIAISKRRDGAAIALAMLALSAGLWSLELYLLTVIEDLGLLNSVFAFFRSGMFFIPSFMALFVWFLVGKSSNYFLYLVVVPGLVASALLSILNNTILPSQLNIVDNGYTPAIDNVYLCFVGVFIWCVIGAIAYCIARYRSALIREKQRIKWLLITLVVAFIFGISSMYLFSFSFYLSKLSGPLTNILFLTSLLYATIKHDLMDVRLAMSMAAARIVLLAAFCWMYFSLTSAFTEDSFGGTVTLMIFLVVVLEAYPRILQWLIPNAKRVFSASKYDIDKLILELQISLDKCVSIFEVNNSLQYAFNEKAGISEFSLLLRNFIDDGKIGFQPENHGNKSIYLQEEDEQKLLSNTSKFILVDESFGTVKNEMLALGFQGMAPLVVDGKVIALLLVNYPDSEKYFRYEDISLVSWLAKEMPHTIWRVRNMELFEDELIEAKKKLSLINIFNHYHHDIKAPLSIIDGVVTHELYDKDQQRKVILEQVALGSRLIAAMAGLLKGKRQRDVESVSIDLIIKDCVLIFNHALAKADIDISDNAIVNGDADDLKIMFINIIKNSSEAAKPDEKISISVRSWSDDRNLWVSIADNGEGIEREKLNQLWTSGFTTKKTGSGIGLQAIKRIADEHNATIKVESHLGRGTDFTLGFPLVS